ncbi:putative Transposase-associated domain-containing protein [Helianthus debilis subsp. tardiflorus]
MEWYNNRSWMYKMTNSDGFINTEYCENLKKWLDFVYSKDSVVDRRVTKRRKIVYDIRCSCLRCQNSIYLDRETVQKHLLKKGFMLDYYTWYEHGETSTREVGQPSTMREVDDDDDGCRRMVLDSMCSLADNSTINSNLDSSTLERDVPNLEAMGFYNMLQATDEPLWEGEKATDYSKLQAVTSFLNWKSLYNVSTACYDHIISMVKELMPVGNKLPENFYYTKKSLEKLFLPKERIDVCKNHCMLFYKQDMTLTQCKWCGESRYKSGQNKVPHLVMTYMPIGPRLKMLYMSTKTAKNMTWHHDHKTKEGSMAHPSDGKAWKHFDSVNPGFANEIRNVRLGLCTDGFNPNNSNSNPCSLWPVFLTIYNLPPWMSLKDTYIKLCLVIPGRKSPGQNVDVFLRPLIDELKELYEEGIEVYDAYRKENFMMRAILLWTVSDFPAYAMLSGWSTHGHLACPYCMGDTKAFRLQAGGKASWFDCHRRFLPRSHPFRSDRNGFRANKSMSSLGPPPELTGWQIYEQVCDLPSVYEGVTYNLKKKISGFGKTHNWVKRSIFWELEYWPMLSIRHNLDVMHIEKNVFENLFHTIMDTQYTKDNIKARVDLEQICNRPSLHTWVENNNKHVKPKATYALTKMQVNEVCKWLKTVKFPDGYASNIGGCVNVKDGTFYSFKSHDCHVFMQRLLPIVLRGMLPKQILEPVIELCTFFRVICSKVLHIEDLQKLEKSIVVTICKLEKIFPPGFFDSMEHLVIHLTNEAIRGGPVQFRWMYPYERKLGRLKNMIRNKARVEGSIVESYLLSVFKHPSRRLYDKGGKNIVLTDEDRHKAHTYILLNCQELHEAIWSFDEHLRASFPHCDQATLDKKKDSSFAEWLQCHVMNDPGKEHLRDIAQGPLTYVQSHKGYFVNGYKFHTRTSYHGRVTQNSGVCVKGASYDENESDYYGLLNEILEVEYHSKLGSCVVVLFKCTWFDPVNGVRVDPKTGMVDVKPKAIGCVDDPFILASQAQQVYYTPYPSKEKSLKDWWAVVKTTPRGVYELAEDASEVGDEDSGDEEQFFQEKDRLVYTVTDDLLPITHVDINDDEHEDIIDDDHEDVNNDDREEAMFVDTDLDEAAFEDTDLADDDVEEFEDEDED